MNNAEARQLLELAGVCYPSDEDDSPELLTLNMNDTWGWAIAWGEPIPQDKLVEVATLFIKYGDCGLYYWVSEQHEAMRSEFQDINRFVDFVRHEEALRKEVPDSNARAYRKLAYELGRTT